MPTREKLIELIVSYINELKRQIKDYATKDFGKTLLSAKSSRVNPIVKLVAVMSLLNSLIKNEPINLGEGFEAIKNVHDIKHEDDKVLHGIYLQCSAYLKHAVARDAKSADSKQDSRETHAWSFENNEKWKSLLINDVEVIKIIAAHIIKNLQDYACIYQITKGEARAYLQQTQFYNRLIFGETNSAAMVSKEDFFAAVKKRVIYIHSFALAKRILGVVENLKEFKLLISSSLQTFYTLEAILADKEIALNLYNNLFAKNYAWYFKATAFQIAYCEATVMDKNYFFEKILYRLLNHAEIADQIAKHVIDKILKKAKEGEELEQKGYLTSPDLQDNVVKIWAQDSKFALVLIQNFQDASSFFVFAKIINRCKSFKEKNIIDILMQHAAVAPYIANFNADFAKFDAKNNNISSLPDQKAASSAMTATSAGRPALAVVTAKLNSTDSKESKPVNPELDELLKLILDYLKEIPRKIKKIDTNKLLREKDNIDGPIVKLRGVIKILNSVIMSCALDLTNEDEKIIDQAMIKAKTGYFKSNTLEKIFKSYQKYVLNKGTLQSFRGTIIEIIDELVNILSAVGGAHSAIRLQDVQRILSWKEFFQGRHLIRILKYFPGDWLFNYLTEQDLSHFLKNADDFVELVKVVDVDKLLFIDNVSFAERLVLENGDMKLNADQFLQLARWNAEARPPKKLVTEALLKTEKLSNAAARFIDAKNFYEYFNNAPLTLAMIVKHPRVAKELFLRCFNDKEKIKEFIDLYILKSKFDSKNPNNKIQQQLLLEITDSVEVREVLARHITQEQFDRSLSDPATNTNLAYRLAQAPESALVLVKNLYKCIDGLIGQAEALQDHFERLHDVALHKPKVMIIPGFDFFENIAAVLVKHPAVIKYFAERITVAQLLRLKKIPIYGLHPACLIADAIPINRVDTLFKAATAAEIEEYKAQFPDNAAMLVKYLNEINGICDVPLDVMNMVPQYLFWAFPAPVKPTAIVGMIDAHKAVACSSGDEKPFIAPALKVH